MSGFSAANSPLAQSLRDVFGDKLADLYELRGQLIAVIPSEHWLSVAWQLRDEPALLSSS